MKKYQLFFIISSVLCILSGCRPSVEIAYDCNDIDMFDVKGKVKCIEYEFPNFETNEPLSVRLFFNEDGDLLYDHLPNSKERFNSDDYTLYYQGVAFNLVDGVYTKWCIKDRTLQKSSTASIIEKDSHGNWGRIVDKENGESHEIKRKVYYYGEDDPTIDYLLHIKKNNAELISEDDAKKIINAVLKREGTENTDKDVFIPAYWETIERAASLPLYGAEPFYFSGEVCDGEQGYNQESSSNTFEMVPVSESNMILKVKADCSPDDECEVILNLEINLLKQNGKWLVDDVFVFDYDNTKKSMKEEAQTRITELDKQVTSGEWEAAMNADKEAGIEYGGVSYDEMTVKLEAYKLKYLSE